MRHRFHSMCPYFAMFPESFAEKWIARLTKPGDTVLDPFSGRGTTALTALLCGRKAISSDVNDVAVCLTKAKTTPPPLSRLKARLTQLRNEFDSPKWKRAARTAEEFFIHAYAPVTLAQLLYLRKTLKWQESHVDNMISALVLGSLHGETTSTRYLSNQMPRTISTKPRYSVKFWKDRKLVAPPRDAFTLLRQMAEFRYVSPLPKGDSVVLHTDMRNLPRAFNQPEIDSIRCAVTSPPYLNVTSFEEDQWLRLWFLGGPTHPKKGVRSRDDRHGTADNYWSFISDMWRSLGAVMGERSHVVVRIGSRNISPDLLKRSLAGCAQFSGRKVKLLSHQISEIKGRQTDAFRPGTTGCVVELDCHFGFTD